MDKELNSLLESILLLLIQMLKGFIMGVWHGLRKALQNKCLWQQNLRCESSVFAVAA